MDSLIQDVRHSVRSLRRQRGFALVAVISLSIGIGVNTAIFSVFDSLLFRPPALQHLARSVVVYHRSPGRSDSGTSFRAFQAYRDRTTILANTMAVTGARPLVLTEGLRRDQVWAEPVTSSFFSIAAIRMLHGTPFPADVERNPASSQVIVLSHAFWKSRFNADPAVVGTTITINGLAFVVTGVADEGFIGLDRELSVDMWIPVTTWATLIGESHRLTSNETWLTTIGELAPGVTLEQAQAAMAAAGTGLELGEGVETAVRAADAGLTDIPVDAIAIIGSAFGIGLIVLVLACTNVANLLLARAAERRHEMTVRAALGSGRLRLLRLWVAESFIVSIAAAALGFVVASWLLSALVTIETPVMVGEAKTPALPFVFTLDGRIFAFTSVLTAVTALLVGLLAGLRSSRAAVANDRGSERYFAPGFNVRTGVIAMQMALSTLLLIPCGLFVRSALNATSVSPGFDISNVLLLPISASQSGVKVEKPEGFERDLAERVRRIPGVLSATVMDPVPLWFSGNFANYSIEGHGSQRFAHASIGLQYFETMRIPLLAGRDFGPGDTATSPPVAIVNETLARRYWPGGNAIGQRMKRSNGDIEIVGIAKDAKYVTLSESPQPWLYRPFPQWPATNLGTSLAARTAGDPATVHAAIEREVRAIIPNWPGFQYRRLDEVLTVQRQMPQLAATLLGALGLFGLFLATLGVYGVMAYVVRQRRKELGIRIALGAPMARVVGLVVKQGMVVCVAGALTGIAVALVGMAFLSSALFGIGGVDFVTSATVMIALLSIAYLACYLPARAATRISPSAALRND